MRYCLDLPHWSTIIGQWLYDWQTLLSGFLAVGAAATGTFFLRRQIAQSEEHERARLRARLASARAVLPLALDEVAGFAVKQIGALAELHIWCSRPKIGGEKPQLQRVELPATVVPLLREAVEAADANSKENALELLSDIVSEIQVLRARLEGVEARLSGPDLGGLPLELEEYIVQSARIYALALGLLPFARRADDDGPPAVTWNDAQNCLRSCKVEIAGVDRILERKLKESLTIWVAKGEA